ncbi:MAG: DUF615 domain-containing protein [Proteobacteria bacterium]|nr:DUF615 domain-containing protein [Pseudomonadota bacterium]
MEELEPTEKSKSKIKRELLALQDLGRELVELPEKQLLKMPVSEILLEAIRAARGLKKGARQRQLRYIGGLISNEDAPAIQQALASALTPSRELVEKFHAVEKWRDRLLSDGDLAINEFLVLVPDADRQQLRNLVRNANHELKDNKAPRSARLLFGYCRDLLNTIT